MLKWPAELLASFASQYGPPDAYSLLVRAKLVGTYGVVARMLDVVQQNVLAPYVKKGKPPKAVLPSPGKTQLKSKNHGYTKAELDDVFGIARHGAGMDSSNGEASDSDSVDTGSSVS